MTTTKLSAPSAEEALAALALIGDLVSEIDEHARWTGATESPTPGADGLKLIRSLLESVAQERRDWDSLQEWVRSNNQHDAYAVAVSSGHRVTVDDGIGPMREFDASSRAEALSKAAAWARAEMGSKT
jgi:hypothetical protein